MKHSVIFLWVEKKTTTTLVYLVFQQQQEESFMVEKQSPLLQYLFSKNLSASVGGEFERIRHSLYLPNLTYKSVIWKNNTFTKNT